jgi:trans-2,3-dihydro-3-hydroxyanthranilate isomerase
MGDVLLPLGLDGVVAFTRDVADADHAAFASEAPADVAAAHAARADLSVRMFAPLVGIIEDPATGSGVAALAAALAVADRSDGLHRLSVAQGIDMGRPSALRTQVRVVQGHAAEVRVGGACVPVLDGHLRVA